MERWRDFFLALLYRRDEFKSVHITSLFVRSFHCRQENEDSEREKLVPYLIRYSQLPTPELRREVIIALGWVYAPD